MDTERKSLSERLGHALIDDLNRNIGMLRQLEKIEDVCPSDIRTLANCTIALCLMVRTIISVQGLQSVRSE